MDDARLEDLTFLADHGVQLDEAARRVGMKPTSLRTTLKRHGHGDLLRRLTKEREGVW